MIRFILCLFIGWWLPILPAYAQTAPRKLLIYYGYPSSSNHPTNGYALDKVAADMVQYDYIVLGGGLEKTAHSDHTFTQNLVTGTATNAIRFWGYIDLGIRKRNADGSFTYLKNYSQSEIETRIQEWKVTGVDGIFFDDVEYGYDVNRGRMNAAIQYAHNQSLSVVVNGNRPDDIFGQQVEPTYNPTGAGTTINSRDVYLSESFLISEENYTNPTDWQPKAALVENYRQQLGFRIWSVTTNSLANANEPDTQVTPQFQYAWYGAWLYNHEATGWGEYGFSADVPNNGISPFRTRPSPTNPGTTFAGPVCQSNNLFTRYTNTGKIRLDSQAHTGDFTVCATCQSAGSGVWQTASGWTCGRVPLACDTVEVLPGHIITLSDNADAGQLLLRGRLQLGSYRLRLRIY